MSKADKISQTEADADLTEETRNFVRLTPCEDVPLDRPRKVEVPGREALAVYRLGDDFFVTEDVCTHGNGSLSKGRIVDGVEIRCPVHRGTFDIRTGKAVKYPCTEPLMIFPTEIRDGEVWAALDDGKFAT